MTVYKATNLINNKVYIGQTHNAVEHRANQHWREAKSVKKKNTYFHEAILKYGFENFLFEKIEEVDTDEQLDEREQYWIEFYNSTDAEYGYNLDSGGKFGKKSESTKQKIGLTTQEKLKDPGIKKLMIEGLKKGTVSWQKICEEKRLDFTCPVCGKVIRLTRHEYAKRKYCSGVCAAIDHREDLSRRIREANYTNSVKRLERDEHLREFVLGWVANNAELVLDCPKNKISTNLNDLTISVDQEFSVKDWRVIVKAFNLDNKKDLLQYFQNYINENIC